MTFLSRLCLATFAAASWTAVASAQNLAVNGDFETGSVVPFTSFTTSNGTIGGSPSVLQFDVTGLGASYAVQLHVGQVTFQAGIQHGGGISQLITFSAGTASLSVDYAAFNTSGFSNGEGGVFSLLVDDVLVDTETVGNIGGQSIVRGTLSGTVNVAAGTHAVTLQATRPYITTEITPLQYFDNLTVSQAMTATPEPASLALLGAGLAGLAAARRRRG